MAFAARAQSALQASVAPSDAVVSAKADTAQLSAAIDKGLEEVRVERVRVDGLALMKIIKHAKEAHLVIPAPAGTSNATVSFSPAVGQLLGVDSNGTLEVSNVFALPAGSLGGSAAEGESETRGVRGATKYTSSIITRLHDLKSDASIVGFYTSCNNGQHMAMSGFVEALLGAQLNGGGIGGGAKAVPVGRGAKATSAPTSAVGTNKSGKGIALVFDAASAAQGYVGLKAFRLSAAFVEAHRAGKFDTQSLIDHKLVPSNMLEELPVTVHSSPLLSAFLSTIVTPTASSSLLVPATLSARATPLSPLPAFANLSLPTSVTGHSPTPAPLSAPIAALISALDTHQAHLSTLSFQSRQLARERTRVEGLPTVMRRKAENEQRAKEGLSLLPPTADELTLVEPSRLETMCALAGVEGAARVLSEEAGVTVARSYGVRAGITLA